MAIEAAKDVCKWWNSNRKNDMRHISREMRNNHANPDFHRQRGYASTQWMIRAYEEYMVDVAMGWSGFPFPESDRLRIQDGLRKMGIANGKL